MKDNNQREANPSPFAGRREGMNNGNTGFTGLKNS